MKTAWIAVFALLFVSAAGFAEAPAPRVTLAQALGQAGCPTPESAVFLAAKPSKPNRPNLEKALCTATAQCEFGTVSCNSNVSTTSCAAFDRNCSLGQPGHVTCGGVTTWCPTACPADDCTTGNYRQQACCRCGNTGDCQDCFVCEHGYETPHCP
ncbi:MAG TPA: hypothetical protein VHN15_11510 [Thermoanaerobaculia bacterium]|nr:hypothetical protein [Thermoanaerobaculia bacterium]